MTDVILFLILAAILAAASLFIYKEKKRGVKCIGCPAAHSCAARNGSSDSCCSCHTDAI